MTTDRLSAVPVRFRILNPLLLRPTRFRAETIARAEAIADAIRDCDGNVWPAIDTFDICYSHAVRIRRGWRPGGQHAPPIPYRSRGWLSGRH